MISESVEEPAQEAAEDTAPSSLEDIAEDSEEVQTQGLNSENPISPSAPAQHTLSQTAQTFASLVAGSSPIVMRRAAAQALEVNPPVNSVSDASTQVSLDDTGASMYALAARNTPPSPYRSSLPGLGTFEVSPRADYARSTAAEVPSPITQISHLSPTLHNRSESSTSPVPHRSLSTQLRGHGYTSPLQSPNGPQSARQVVSPAVKANPSPATEWAVLTPFDHALVAQYIDPSLDCVVASNPDNERLFRVAVAESIVEDVLAFVKARSVAQLTCDAATQTSPSPSPAPQASLAKRKAENEVDTPRPSQRPRLDPTPEKLASPTCPTTPRFGYRPRRSKMVYDKDGNRDYEALINPDIPILDEDDGGIEWDNPMFRDLPSFFRPVTGNKKKAAKSLSTPTAEDKGSSADMEASPASLITPPEVRSPQALNHDTHGTALVASPLSTAQNAIVQIPIAHTPRRAWGIGGLARSVSKLIPGFHRVRTPPQEQQVAIIPQTSEPIVGSQGAHPVVEASEVAISQPIQHSENTTPQQGVRNQTPPDISQSPQHPNNVQSEPGLKRRMANLLETNHAPATTRAMHKKQRQQGKQSFRSIEEIAREKAARYRRRALEEENRAARASELARKEESLENGPRRLGEGLDHEQTQTGGKRKRTNVDELETIPNPPGAYGLNEDYFGQSWSDEDEETPTKKATQRLSGDDEGPRRKVPRLDYGDTHILGDPHRARPYTGVFFADPQPTYTGGNAFGHQESTSDSARDAAGEQAAKIKAADAKAAKIAAANSEAAKLKAQGVWVNVSSEGDLQTNKAGTFDINALCCDESDSDEETAKEASQTSSTAPPPGSSNTVANSAAPTLSRPAGPSNGIPGAANRPKRAPTVATKSPRSGIAQFSAMPSTDAAEEEEEATSERPTTARKSPKAPYLPVGYASAEAEQKDASQDVAKPPASVPTSSILKNNPGKLPSKLNAPLTPKKNVGAVESLAKPANTSAQSLPHAALPNPPATIGKIDTYGLMHKPKQPSRLKQSIRYSTSTVASDDGDADEGTTHSDQAQAYSTTHADQQDDTLINQVAMALVNSGDANEWRSGFLQPAIDTGNKTTYSEEYGYESEPSAEGQSCIIPDDGELDSDIEEYARTYDNELEVTAVLQSLPNAQINYREGCESEALEYLDGEEDKLEAIRLRLNGLDHFVDLKKIRDEEGYDDTIDSEHDHFPPARPNYVEAGIMNMEVYAFMQANWTDRDMEDADASFTKGLEHWKRTGELLPDDIPT